MTYTLSITRKATFCILFITYREGKFKTTLARKLTATSSHVLRNKSSETKTKRKPDKWPAVFQQHKSTVQEVESVVFADKEKHEEQYNNIARFCHVVARAHTSGGTMEKNSRTFYSFSRRLKTPNMNSSKACSQDLTR